MDGLSRPIGASVPIVFKGRTWILPPMRLHDFGVVEQHLLSRRPNLVAIALEAARQQGLTEEATDLLVDRALKQAAKSNRISSEEMKEWLDTREGVAFTLWQCLEKSYPGQLTLEDTNDILQKMAEDKFAEMLAKRDQASGMDALGNSTGPTAGSAAGPKAAARAAEPDPHETLSSDARIGGNGGTASSKRSGSRKKSRK